MYFLARALLFYIGCIGKVGPLTMVETVTAIAAVVAVFVSIATYFGSLRHKQMDDAITLAVTAAEKRVADWVNDNYYGCKVVDLKLEMVQNEMGNIDGRLSRNTDLVNMCVNSVIGNPGILPLKDRVTKG